MVFGLRAYKALRLDGLGGLFYHKSWDMIHEDIYTAINNFLREGRMRGEVNETFIT